MRQDGFIAVKPLCIANLSDMMPRAAPVNSSHAIQFQILLVLDASFCEQYSCSALREMSVCLDLPNRIAFFDVYKRFWFVLDLSLLILQTLYWAIKILIKTSIDD